MEGTEMTSQRAKETLNRFHYASLSQQSSYINPRIVYKLKILNATITPKLHTFRASVPGYYVEWFYNSATATYMYISGAINGVVFMDQGDLDSLCDELERMFSYNI
jgi:hypothetical protein